MIHYLFTVKTAEAFQDPVKSTINQSLHQGSDTGFLTPEIYFQATEVNTNLRLAYDWHEVLDTEEPGCGTLSKKHDVSELTQTFSANILDKLQT